MTGTAVTTRCLCAADSEAYFAVRLEALELYPTAFLTTAEEFRGRPRGALRAQLDEGKSWGVFDAGALIGIAALLPMRHAAAAHRAELGAFFVTPSAQGSGAADRLMNGLASAATRQGIWQLELYVATTNPRAIRFYERHGFEIRGLLPNAALIGDTMTSDHFMTRDLR